MIEKPPVSHTSLLSPQQLSESRVVFLGGIGYDAERNLHVASTIAEIAHYSGGLALTGFRFQPESNRDAIFIKQDEKLELSTKDAMSRLDEDVTLRFTRLHEQRSQELIASIEASGGLPVDAVFQSADASTGILAMHKRPDLFRHVVLLDPSSIIKLPPRKQYLLEEWKNGNLKTIFNSRKATAHDKSLEARVGVVQKYRRVKKSRANGNDAASYLSYQAHMLHEIAEGEFAPRVSVVASRLDHAYNPERLLNALVSIDDVESFFITNTRHGLGGSMKKLEQVVDALLSKKDLHEGESEKIQFAEDVPSDYKTKLLNIIKFREDKN